MSEGAFGEVHDHRYIYDADKPRNLETSANMGFETSFMGFRDG